MFKMRIPIQIYDNHIHLSRGDSDKLFGKGYEFTKLKQLSQPGEWIYQETVNIQGSKGSIQNIHIIGPFKKNTQIEITGLDCNVLGVTSMIRISGDIQNTAGVKIIGPYGSIFLQNGIIIPQKHLHCTVKEAQELGIKNGDLIKIKTYGNNSIIFENIKVRVKDKYVLDFHITKQEAIQAGLEIGDWGEIVNLFEVI